MELSGHSGEVFAARFNPEGNYIASGSMDRTIMLWRTYGDCENYGVMKGHKGAVVDLHWSRDSSTIYTASADTTLASWDLTTGLRERRFIGHEEVVNSTDVSRRGMETLVSGSDDCYIGFWDTRTKYAAAQLETQFPVTAVAWSEDGSQVFSGGIDNDIRVWDVRKQEVVYTLLGHADTITSLRVSPDGQTLLSNSMDSTVRTWDVRPFAAGSRHLKTFDGAVHGGEKNLIKASWDKEGRRIATGAGDGTAMVWSNDTGKLLYKLPGHKGTVNCAELSPGGEPVILTGSTDKNLLLGELK